MAKKNNKIIWWIIGIILIIIIVVIIYLSYRAYLLSSYPVYANHPYIKDKCTLRFVNLVDVELKNNEYLNCNSDDDCKVLSCNSCVNLIGYDRYAGLTKLCNEPVYRCGMPKGCNCLENKCVSIS